MPDPAILSYAPLGPVNRLAQLITIFSRATLLLIFLVLIIQINRRITAGHSGDFRHFYFAARALLDHRDPYGSMPLDVVEHALGRPAGPVEIAWYTTDTDRYLYPPLIAFLYTPLANLRFDVAQRAVLIVNAAMVYAGIWLIVGIFMDRFRLPAGAWLASTAALLGVLLNLDKIHVDLQMFQTNSLMFFLFALSLFWLDREPILAGIPLGMILNIKYLSLATLPWLLIRRRWSTAASCTISGILFALLPALLSGWRDNLHNLQVAYGGLLHMVGVHGSVEQANVDDIRDYLSCSITSAMARTAIGRSNLGAGMLLAACVAIGSILIVIALYVRNAIPSFIWPAEDEQKTAPFRAVVAVEFVSIVAATLCFSPQTNTRHLMLALLITLPISVFLLTAKSWAHRAVLTVAALAIAIGFIWPPGGQAPDSRQLAHWWFGVGGQSWCLLFAMIVLVAVGTMQAIMPKVTPLPPES